MSGAMTISAARALRLLPLPGCSGLTLLLFGLSGCATAVPPAREAPPTQQTAHRVAAAPTPARPGELALRKHLASVQRGEPDYDDMTPELARLVRSQPAARDAVVQLGPVESVLFKGQGARGADIYEVTTTHGLSEWRIMLAPDGKIAFLLFRPLEKPPAQALRPDEFVSAVQARVKQAARDDQFSGTVLVARADQPICQLAVGLADRERNIANTLETKFRLGSMNKMFTAVSILQLVQAGRVALGDPLGKYLPDYPNRELARQVTLHHLLTHTGGGPVTSSVPNTGSTARSCASSKTTCACWEHGLWSFHPGATGSTATTASCCSVS